MNEHALEALEYGRVLDAVASHATSEQGVEAIRRRRPASDVAAVEGELEAVDEMVGWLTRQEDWAPPHIPNIADRLERLSIPGVVWSEPQLVDAARLLRSAREVRRSVLPASSGFSRLADLAEGLLKDEALQDRLETALDEEAGEFRDEASPTLRRLRKDVRAARSDLVAHLEQLVGKLPDDITVPDASVTVRGGRYCIPIRREGRSQVGGIVHDESASRATLFVEPPSAIELMNGLRELELAEDRELERLRRELTDALRPRREALIDTLGRLVELDSRFARGRYALLRGCSRPKLTDRQQHGYRVVHGRHPLLLESPDPVVPFELILHPGENTVLVTGPNAGGKTVLLKAVGLASAMTQAGLLPAVGPGTELPVFNEIFADIGDEQSIDASLSTFSAHLRNLRRVLEHADTASLCLIDEIGGATDPVEGTALARAVLLELTERGCMTIATSHLGGLKTLPGERAGIVSAGLEFDVDQLEPLYRLVKGRPGRSYGLAMARRAGLPGQVIDRAESFLSSDEAAAGRLLADLERKERQLDDRLSEISHREERAAEREKALQEAESRLAEREEELEEEAHRQAREFLLEARNELDAALKADREAARDARKNLEAQLRSHSRALQEAERRKKGESPDAEPELEVGQRVWVTGLDRAGRLVELRDGQAVVEVGSIKLQIEPHELETVERSESTERDRVPTGGGRELEPRSEIDLRGLTAEEAEFELLRAVDVAVSAGLTQLRIIHGKGTGVLRQRVAESARQDARVNSYRLAAPHEGGSGVTVLELDSS